MAGGTPVLVHNCNTISESTMNHVLNGDVNKDGEFGGWHMHPGNDPGAYPEGRFINGDMITNADGSVSVRGTVGSYDPETWDMTPKSSVGHTFFPEGWGPGEIQAAGEDLFANGTYSNGGTRVLGSYNGVDMLGFLEKGADGQVKWDFAYAGGVWQPTRTPQAHNNLLVAMETLAISFGKRAYVVRQFLEALDGLASSSSGSGTVNSTTAYVKKSEGGRFEICDKYGQFENIAISEVELRSALSALLCRIETDFPEVAKSRSNAASALLNYSVLVSLM